MFDVITIGNATQDVYLFSRKFRVLKDSRVITGEMECFAFGTKIELDDIRFEIGGGATNTAYTFKLQGLKTACLSRVGRDSAGDEVREFLKKSGITDLCVTDKRVRTAHSVFFLNSAGERTILVYRGAANYFKTNDIDFKKIKNTHWLYLTSLAGNITLLDTIISFAKRHGIRVALNPGKLEIEQNRTRLTRILKNVDILLLNREEAVEVTHRVYRDDKGILQDLRHLCPGIVVVTEGDKGSIIAWGKHWFRVIIKPVKAVDTTGAGDAFGSGFLAGYIKSHGSCKAAITLAARNAAAEVRVIGAKNGLLAARAVSRFKPPTFRTI